MEVADVERDEQRVAADEVAERRAKMLRHVADVTYDQTLRHERGGGGGYHAAAAGYAASEVEADTALAAQPPPPPPPLTGGRSNRTRAAAFSAASRLATNLLRAADSGCLQGLATAVSGIYPQWHKYAADDKWGLNCSCTVNPPRFYWGPKLAPHQARTRLWTRGKVPTEVCRCLHCATLCPLRGEEK